MFFVPFPIRIAPVPKAICQTQSLGNKKQQFYQSKNIGKKITFNRIWLHQYVALLILSIIRDGLILGTDKIGQ
jgi:hypothetical protein